MPGDDVSEEVPVVDNIRGVAYNVPEVINLLTAA